MKKVSRRAFLKTLGALTAVGALARCSARDLVSNALPGAVAQQLPPPQNERWVRSVCQLCPGNCGISVRVLDGRAVKIEGNPLHPINQGALCPKGVAGPQILYNPDRIRGPLRRAGDSWESISWNEAVDLVVDKLAEIRDTGKPHTAVFMHDGRRGPMSDLIARFCQAFGTPNNVATDHVRADGTPLAHYSTLGWKDHAGYDWENVNYLLCFGGSFLEAWQPTVRQLWAYSHMRRGRPGTRSRIVQIEPRLSVAAAKADEWIPIVPGTEGALALGIAHVIVDHELYDKGFVEDHTLGFEDWTDEAGEEHLGFRTLVLRDYPVDEVARITGVSASTIRQLARDFVASKPAVAAGDASEHTNGLFSQMAIQSLNALVGSIGVPGGMIRQRDVPFAPWPDLVQDDVATAGVAMTRLDRADTSEWPLADSAYQAFPEAAMNGDPYEVGILFLYQANPLYTGPSVRAFRESFDRIPFIVSFSPFLDESTQQADLILPDCTYLEKWLYSPIEPSLGYPVLGLVQPVVGPLHETVNTGDVLLEIARRLGSTMAASFPWAGFTELMQFRLRGVFESGRGLMVRGTFEEFWDELRARGVWYDPPYEFEQWERLFTTPSGRFEFYSQHLRAKLETLTEHDRQELETVLDDLRLQARGDELVMPHHEPARYVGDEEEYPFHLNVYELMAYSQGGGANSPWMQELFGLHIKEMWDSWIELHPQTARELGISDRDEVWVESPVGRIKTKARLYPGAMPNVVNMPLGQGHSALGRWAKESGANPYQIIADESDLLTGQPARLATRVKVYKV
ncbi:MAG: molybdopterin-dependent oxidoreductase [Anaerolineae bacterium]|nr:molybdopterin-dependent oxidoreductase [Anaerolineae bacterium]NIN99357.1 molybdopterin-dependent oxidoreductase [Anaerolineae bacterium]NIQ82222.1 molybdopterin-dependent oxidoreductase [Anaerolineae bacterium]